MKLLALDSATEACSAALWIDGEVAERYQVAPRSHAQLLLPMIDQLCAEAEIVPAALDAVAFGRGPGSFTGLRIAAGIAQGIAYGADIAVLPVSTLATLAQSALAQNIDGVMVAIDARMQEVYWGCFSRKDSIMQPVMNESVCPPAAVPLPDSGQWLGLGTGWKTYVDELTRVAGSVLDAIDGDALPRASDMLPLALADHALDRAVAPEQAAPIYLRDQVTHQKGR